MHHGVARDGRNLYPAFPYTFCALTSTGTRPRSRVICSACCPYGRRPPHPNSVFRSTSAISAWQEPAFHVVRWHQPDPQRSAEWNHGAYLVKGLGHCGECHTPRNLLFALGGSRKLAVAVTAGRKAYNISSDSEAGIGAWSDTRIADCLSKGHAKGA
jgi:hypothetical protein